MSISINHHRQGEGPPVVLLHGVGLHWQIWRPVIDLLAREFDVIAPDSPGFGHSPALSAGVTPTIEAYADAFEWFFAELGLERPHVAGNSMGGAIALELARGRAISSACAISPAGFWSSAEVRFCQLSLRPFGQMPQWVRPGLEALARTRAGRVALLSQTFGRPAQVPGQEVVAVMRDLWASPAYMQALDAFSDYRFRSPEQLRSTPVTVAWGKHDRLLLYRTQARRARAMLPWATHVTLGAGHVPTYDDPAAVAAVIRASALEGIRSAGVFAGARAAAAGS